METFSSDKIALPTASPRETVTLNTLIDAYLQEYEVRQFRVADARSRVTHVRAFFGDAKPAAEITSSEIRQYQIVRRQQGAAAGTVNRETSALNRMFYLAVQLDWLPAAPMFPERLRENAPRQGFFEHDQYLAVRRHVPPSFQDVLDFAYYSGWRRGEILELTWNEVDLAGGVIRLTPDRSKTRVGGLLPISPPLEAVLKRRLRRRLAGSDAVFHRDGVTVRVWRRALQEACERAGVPRRLLHDGRRTVARNLIRAGVPERVAMMLTGHKTRAVFDRYNIVNERELFSAGQQLVDYVTRVRRTKMLYRTGRAATPSCS